MRYIKSLLVLCLAVLVVGCASQRPLMDTKSFNDTVIGMATLNSCFNAGVYDADTTAAGRTMLINHISNYSDDMNYLVNAAKRYPTDDAMTHCKELAVVIATYRQRTAANQRQVQVAPQPTFTQPARTICNNIAGQILCSTY